MQVELRSAHSFEQVSRQRLKAAYDSVSARGRRFGRELEPIRPKIMRPADV